MSASRVFARSCGTFLSTMIANAIGYYRRLFADTNDHVVSTNFEAARADTYHQITLPETLFGWLNVTPRVGGRFTYYSTATGPGASTDEQSRGVFNTGAEVSAENRLWSDVHNNLLDIDGVRPGLLPSVST